VLLERVNDAGPLRPGIAVQCTWLWAHALNLDERGGLASEVRAAITELLTALSEPLPPACAAACSPAMCLTPGHPEINR
jgi:hypothetical protein